MIRNSQEPMMSALADNYILSANVGNLVVSVFADTSVANLGW
jgi:hypothetical protein